MNVLVGVVQPYWVVDVPKEDILGMEEYLGGLATGIRDGSVDSAGAAEGLEDKFGESLTRWTWIREMSFPRVPIVGEILCFTLKAIRVVEEVSYYLQDEELPSAHFQAGITLESVMIEASVKERMWGGLVSMGWNGIDPSGNVISVSIEDAMRSAGEAHVG